MTITNEYLGRFIKVASGEMLSPGQCAICGTSDCPEGFVDTKLDVDFFGVIYLCHSCAFELCRVFPDDPYTTLRAKFESAVVELAERDRELSDLRKVLDGLRASIHYLSSNAGPDFDGIRSLDANIGEAANDDAGTAVEQGDSDPGPVKPAEGTKPADPSKPKRGDTIASI